MVHRWTRGEDIAALLWILRQMLEESGSIEQFFAEGLRPDAEDVGRRARIASRPARWPSTSGRPTAGVPRRRGVCYFFPRPSAGSACKRLNLYLRWMVRRDEVDLGAWTSRVADAAHRAARHPRHPARTVPPADALHQPGLADGRRHHARAARAGPRRSGALRFRAVPRRDDGRVRLRPAAGELAVPAEGALPSTATEGTMRRLLLVRAWCWRCSAAAFFAGTRFATREIVVRGVGRRPARRLGRRTAVAGAVRVRRCGLATAGHPRSRSATLEGTGTLRRDRLDQGWQPRRVPDRRHRSSASTTRRPAPRPDKSRWCHAQAWPQPRRVRGMTFSDNGEAITFDECPSGRSGCRAGFAAVPR